MLFKRSKASDEPSKDATQQNAMQQDATEQNDAKHDPAAQDVTEQEEKQEEKEGTEESEATNKQYPFQINGIPAIARYSGKPNDTLEEFMKQLTSLSANDGTKSRLQRMISSGNTLYVYHLQNRIELKRFESLSRHLKEYVLFRTKQNANGPYFLLVEKEYTRQAELIFQLAHVDVEAQAEAGPDPTVHENKRAPTETEAFMEDMFSDDAPVLPEIKEQPLDGRRRRSMKEWKAVAAQRRARAQAEKEAQDALVKALQQEMAQQSQKPSSHHKNKYPKGGTS